jgi:AcrR family transcriptional regulator
MARPRSSRAHQQVLDAALRLFAAEGIDATSMDAIATASGVSKATIYNHWRDKDALCLEVMAYLHGLDEPPIAKTGDHRRDIVSVLAHRPAEREGDLRNRMMPHLAAYAARKPEFAKAWRARLLQPARIQLLQLLKRSIAEGTLPRGLNLEVSVALLMGPLMYRYVLTLMGGRLPSDLAERVVDAFWRAHAVETNRRLV